MTGVTSLFREAVSPRYGSLSIRKMWLCPLDALGPATEIATETETATGTLLPRILVTFKNPI